MNRILHSILLPAVSWVLPLSAVAEEILSSAQIYAAYETVRPGDRLPVAVKLTMADGWHTYAEEPGDSGMPPSIIIKGPAGIETSIWRFPPHRAFTDSAGTTYGYEKEVVLSGEVHIPRSIPVGVPVELTAVLQWMICKDVCVFMKDTVVITIQTGAVSSEPSTEWKLLRVEIQTGH